MPPYTIPPDLRQRIRREERLMQTLEKNIDDPVWRDDIKKILKSLRGRELDRRQIGRETGLRYYLKVQNRLIDLGPTEK